MDAADLGAIWLTLKLATLTTLLLLLIGTPVAWWLSRTQSIFRHMIRALIALPLVLPPTVIGFYFLVFMGPNGALGHVTDTLGWGVLPFTFTGLVIASMLYSMPFVIQPLHAAFESLGERPLEVAATLRASPIDTFFSVVLPMARQGYLTAIVMGFAHTVGEFGVVLMIGGNIPNKTRVISVQIYDYVEELNYPHAHALAAAMLVFSFTLLLFLYLVNPTNSERKLIR